MPAHLITFRQNLKKTDQRVCSVAKPDGPNHVVYPNLPKKKKKKNDDHIVAGLEYLNCGVVWLFEALAVVSEKHFF